MFNPSLIADQLKTQWTTPSDVFSILLILGGDVVARALAMLAGGGFTPVAFSFGWVTYAISALGQDRLMVQDADTQCRVINARTGVTRDNTSWVLGRIMRDFEYWKDRQTSNKLHTLIDHKWSVMRQRNPDARRPKFAGLVVSVYKPSETQPPGIPVRDGLYWSGAVVLILQLSIAAIPCGLFGDWGILMITAVGIILSLITGSLPAWAREKWPCRRDSEDGYILTGGYGNQHAIIILGNGHGLNLEDLAVGGGNDMEDIQGLGTTVAMFLLAVSWVSLLITASALKTNSLFLLAIGSVGMIHKSYMSRWSRRPENYGIPLEFESVIGEPKILSTLLEVERRYHRIGRNMLRDLFPDQLRPNEERDWNDVEAAWQEKYAKERGRDPIALLGG
ncbi:hypothetical protein Asppvi_010874 [Aspergillus pseudoviridinutans]|uniref:Uncharacterized protein n=1 Tax=Aspergillus pseudoviridinutans TaxID=1517512 RepID=A0A9P3EXE9_9EURO|nr:uncharacterized protein Asppvi_010874 [Aspergillus pseudoviridinutans]GIJ91899.1 hypothetical protein Asppvi_010874 [Aspergillus pseudoviridinutans]